ncbi:MAG: AAA family ATPase [Megasphaera sp.]|jgi:wobble nucleotide-excising tRNase|nr:AAA family ATPase [Megasphaera sp.]
MIESIEIRNLAMFNDTSHYIEELKKINSFFGINGSGKTSIGRLILNPTQFPDCKINWEANSELECRVYNSDFIKESFSQDLLGVFTLGKESKEKELEIKRVKDDIERIEGEITKFDNCLNGKDGHGGKEKELDVLQNQYKDIFWRQKIKYGSDFGIVLEGVLASKERFKDKLLQENNDNDASLCSFEDLKERISTVFNKQLVAKGLIKNISIEKITAFEKNSILRKVIIGKENVDITELIHKLNNSDWVKKGADYMNDSSGLCPFCQQKLPESFRNSLVEYFDESYEHDLRQVEQLADNYYEEVSRVQSVIQAILDERDECVDYKTLEELNTQLHLIASTNVERIKQKIQEPSTIVELDSVESVLKSISVIIEKANQKINEQNRIIKNIDDERKLLKSQVWRFITEEAKNDVDTYLSHKKDLEQKIQSLQTKIFDQKKEKKSKANCLLELEKSQTSIIPTLEGINSILSSFGFKSFKLALGDNQRSYKLVRENGEDAKTTLSEGERNFVAFLYFYYLLNGSQDESGTLNNKIVVFDDPVSSLDSDILFIVSTLIRELYPSVLDDENSIKQIFILTHNVYFHKEVTLPKGIKKISNNIAYFVVKKCDGYSDIIKAESNPVSSTYEMLWDELRREFNFPGSVSKAVLPNIMRRILEHYFQLVGGIKLHDLHKHFDGTDIYRCKSLCSFINDASHSSFDDYSYALCDDAELREYFRVFKDIFENTDQIGHYDMMMNKG